MPKSISPLEDSFIPGQTLEIYFSFCGLVENRLLISVGCGIGGSDWHPMKWPTVGFDDKPVLS
ncbi:unnamed protein product [Larinioides sclopetarius]|uniref:Uncharacterized protein n=1 Tax=Larinioides sclopetarius TaxID=280406 RepID=A0AAV1YYL9_9ARAC